MVQQSTFMITIIDAFEDTDFNAKITRKIFTLTCNRRHVEKLQLFFSILDFSLRKTIYCQHGWSLDTYLAVTCYADWMLYSWDHPSFHYLVRGTLYIISWYCVTLTQCVRGIVTPALIEHFFWFLNARDFF